MTAVLSARGLTVGVKGAECVRDFTLEVVRGEAVAITAVGTSALAPLLETLAGLKRPEAGEIAWGDISSRVFDERPGSLARYRKMRRLRVVASFVSPGTSLIHNQTLWDNIALPMRYHLVPPEEDVALKVDGLIEVFGLRDVAASRPAGLPAGVHRRAEIARALALEPALLVMDSPLNQVDHESEGVILSVLGRWCEEKGLAIVASSYEPVQLIPLISRLVVISGERVAGTLEGSALENRRVVADKALLLQSVQGKLLSAGGEHRATEGKPTSSRGEEA